MKPGDVLGPYRVVDKLGEGGMGEVYRARDTSLGRDVAIKVLPAAVADDPDRLARFRREAEALAALNHPNVAQIYGFETGGARPAIVMELVEGPTLADRIRAGPLPLDEALAIARQLTDALEAAHERGIVHRDLKPANVKVRDDGTVKVLDFGLAKALEPLGADDEDPDNSPTITARATQAGVILGTAAYMAPEQARGKTVDRRADVWAFGVVLFEMLCGRRPFDGSDATEVLARVIEREPDWTVLPDRTPSPLRRLLRRCLAKAPQTRLRDIGDARLELRDAEDPADAVTEASDRARPPAAWRSPLVVGAAGLLIGALAAALWLTRPSNPRPTTWLSDELPAGVALQDDANAIAISRDGREIAYGTTSGLFRRVLHEPEALPLPGPGPSAQSPFFSPDGAWLGYWDPDTSELKRVPIGGGVPRVIASLPAVMGASWTAPDTIYVGGSKGILRVSIASAEVETVVPSPNDERLTNPQLLPDGETMLFGVAPPLGSGTRIAVYAPGDEQRTELAIAGRAARYVPTGHLVYLSDGWLRAVPFDTERRTSIGEPVALVENQGPLFRATAYAIADTGTLVWSPQPLPPDRYTLVWVDRQGGETVAFREPGAYGPVRLSPDGSRLAVTASDSARDLDIRVVDLVRQLTTDISSNDRYEGAAEWSPDGNTLVFTSGSSVSEGARTLWTMPANGAGAPEPVTPPNPDENVHETALFVEGANVVYRSRVSDGPWRLLTIPIDAVSATPTVLIDEGSVFNADLHPDDDWIAYEWSRDGETRIYVSPYPGVAADRVQVSSDRGAKPVWSADGTALFYIAPESPESPPTLMAVRSTRTVEGLDFGAPEPMFPVETYYRPVLAARDFDVAADGRFLFVKRSPSLAEAEMKRPIRVVLDWLADLQARVPAGGRR